ncbi:hypothetical protein [Thiocapsa roseopersicina]|uniref:SnoaL-like domain-containing protein n=1 Tax=Thiocapsa roseopersicina TaxID=1058 RepID=A0A1H2XQE1_THIRO|nr:hypothetical protein [Thiocapsa roseopersicina]SDW95053.1 hypothetical protein SAMN05421783_11175 [Thiocapsa roseopersicina]
MTSDPLSIVDAYFAAQSARDFEAMRGFLADQGFCYRSPIAMFDRADEFIQYAAVSSGIILDREIRKVFVDGDDICHFMTYRIQISEKLAVEAAQWSHVHEDRIQRIEAIFDASAYRELFPSDEPAP